MKLICDEISSPEACETFDLKVQGLPGDYRGIIEISCLLTYIHIYFLPYFHHFRNDNFEETFKL